MYDISHWEVCASPLVMNTYNNLWSYYSVSIPYLIHTLRTFIYNLPRIILEVLKCSQFITLSFIFQVLKISFILPYYYSSFEPYPT